MGGLLFKNPPHYADRARELRKRGSKVERLLWNALCDLRKDTKLKFRRQHPLFPFIADFACPQAKIIVELDGASHDLQQEYDTTRSAELQKRGWAILRFSNNEVENNLEGVVLTILKTINEVKALPRPLPQEREGGANVASQK